MTHTKPCRTCGNPFTYERPAGRTGRHPAYCSEPCYPSSAKGYVSPDVPSALELNPVSTERGYTEEETRILLAVEAWKKRAKVKFPTVVQVYAIILSLGYSRGAAPGGQSPDQYQANAVANPTTSTTQSAAP